jgi:hypothetical protein
MSLDLTLIPLDEKREGILSILGVIEPATVLAFETNYYSIFAQLHEIDGHPAPSIVPQSFHEKVKLVRYNDEGESQTEVDHLFGEPLKYVTAEQLANLDIKENPYHKAIKAYIDALPRDTRIVLFWH